MSEHKIPRSLNNSTPSEAFQINDPEVGKTFAVRELTDAQILRFMQNTLATQQHMMNQAIAALAE